jgi:transposase
MSASPDRIEMSQRERDILTIMKPVLTGQRSQVEAAELLRLSVRQVRRIQHRLERQGDAALVHRLRGRPSNRKRDEVFRQSVVDAYASRYHDFGPTLACEKLAEQGLHVKRETLRRWLLDAGLWERERRRDPHRSRRPRRACFGELVQIDASIHDWLEGRGETLILIAMIDDATGRVEARFFHEATVLTHMELLRLWLLRHGRPGALYSDRHSIFEAQDKGRALVYAETQFGRALRELGIDLIRARSPQAKGRVERLFGTAQDRWVKELRLAGVTTCLDANRLLTSRLLPGHNRAFGKEPGKPEDAHRPLGPSHDLAAILSVQESRVVANDYTVRFCNRLYQLLPPAYPGLRKGKVVIEQRLGGEMAIRFGGHYLGYRDITGRACLGGSAPKPPEFTASTADASGGEGGSAPQKGAEPAGMQPTARRSGCTPAEPCPPGGVGQDSAKRKHRPAQDHPYRRGFKPRN